MSDIEHLIENYIRGMALGRSQQELAKMYKNELRDTGMIPAIMWEIAQHVVYSLYDGFFPDFPDVPSVRPEQQHGRIFQEIVVEYPSVSTYPEYEGKPYFSIKYMEDGHGFIGYGTYKPEVLSDYLIKYFMPPVQPEIIRCKDCQHWKDSDGVYRRGFDAESKCPLNLEEVYEGSFYCGMAERRE